jgi:hypothetical protein
LLSHQIEILLFDDSNEAKCVDEESGIKGNILISEKLIPFSPSCMHGKP